MSAFLRYYVEHSEHYENTLNNTLKIYNSP
jgi:hypothetical protein